MTRFLRTIDSLINADRIERIEEGKPAGSLRRSRAILSEGNSVTLIDDIDEIERTLLPVVAATPGYVRLRYYAANDVDDTARVERMPVVAWRIAEDLAIPVTPDIDGDDTIPSAVLLPDGQVVQPLMASYPNEEAWLAEMARQAAGEPKAAE